MGQNRRHFLFLALGALTVFIYVCRLQEVRRWQAEQAAPYGRFTAAQIMARSEPLFQTFFPECSSLAISAERQTVGKTESATRLLWAVDCADAAGHHLAYLCWDAVTGDLVYASRLRAEGVSASAKPDSEVLGLAKDWLYALEIADRQEKWRLTETRLAPPSNLHVYWRSEHHAAVVVVDKNTGDFICATNGQPIAKRVTL